MRIDYSSPTTARKRFPDFLSRVRRVSEIRDLSKPAPAGVTPLPHGRRQPSGPGSPDEASPCHDSSPPGDFAGVGSRPRVEPLEDRIAPAMIFWGNPSGGDWDTAANWVGGVKPGSADDAMINIAVAVPITHSLNVTDAINSLSVTANAPVNLGNGTLQVAGTLASNGSLTIAGGTLRNATVQAGTTITAVNSSNTFSGVTLDGTLDMGSVFAPKMTVTSGLTLNGTILLGGHNGSDVAALTAQGTQTWSGTGSILFGGSDTTTLAVSDGATLTLGTA